MGMRMKLSDWNEIKLVEWNLVNETMSYTGMRSC